MTNFNLTELRDKIEGCWIGKNIGGTMGGPYEGTHDILEVTGYKSAKGEPLPNDDLDLQLVWLVCMEDMGPYTISAMDLAEYWISFIGPHWNEYGIGKSNLRIGLQPPLSGSCNNDWKDSNGAWIRSEIWACLAPGNPDAAIKYAFLDACVDHGMGEGTFAAIFTAALQSAAFVEKDIRKLIDIGLSKIPEDCRVARAIKLLLKSYDDGLDWKTTRNLIVKDSEDLGWFEAPANVAFSLLGILYGEGDFKKSMLYTINCGDDTDCTAGTTGSILGIINGKKSIPEDWSEYIGDKIITLSIDKGTRYDIPKTCTELTDRVMKLIPVVAAAKKLNLTVSENETVIDEELIKNLNNTAVGKDLANRSEHSFDVNLGFATATVSYNKFPRLHANEELKVHIHFNNRFGIPHNLSVRFLMPDGFTVKGDKSVYLQHLSAHNNLIGAADADYIITAGENTESYNRIIVEVLAEGRPSIGLFEMVILG